MLLSMTGFGAAACSSENISVSVEIKTVNNRYLKLTTRISDGFAAFESKVESLLRESLSRGSVSVALRIRNESANAGSKINKELLADYFSQLKSLNTGAVISLDGLLRLPGVIEDDSARTDDFTEAAWMLSRITLLNALDNLKEMRAAEGASMQNDLEANLSVLEQSLGEIELFAPNVAEQYRNKLTDRISKILNEHKLTLSPTDIVREVALFTDKSDISEEIVRFQSHLAQFRSIIANEECCGRKLDFLTQELLRETNTIGSKSNDAAITKLVVDMKTVIEKIREMIQNVE